MIDPTSPNADDRLPPPELLAPSVLIPAFVLLIVIAYALFARGAGTAVGNELSKHQALFAAVNAATLTGFQQARNADHTPVGQTTLLALMVGGTLFSLVGGGLAVTRISRSCWRDRTVAISAVAAVIASGVLGAILDGGTGRTPFDGAYQAISALGNCGLYIGQLPTQGDPRVLGLLLPLALIGSLGLPVLLDLLRLRPSAHAGRVLAGSAAVYLVTVAVLFALLAWHGPTTTLAAATVASREAVNARSAGFPFQFVTSLPPATGVVIFIAMLIGGAPGGTAGGLKVTTVTALVSGAWAALRGKAIPRAAGIALAWALAYLTLLLTVTVALVLADPELPVDRVIFLATSALGNVGLSHDPVSPSTAGMYVLSITMLAGRILPVLLLWTIADRMPDVTEAIG